MTTQIVLAGHENLLAYQVGDAESFVRKIAEMQSYLSETALIMLAKAHFGGGCKVDLRTDYQQIPQWSLGEISPTFTHVVSSIELRVVLGHGVVVFALLSTSAAKAIEAQLAQAQKEAQEAKLAQSLLHKAVRDWLFPKGVPVQCEHKKPPRLSAKRQALVDVLYPNGLPYDCPHYDDFDIRDED